MDEGIYWVSVAAARHSKLRLRLLSGSNPLILATSVLYCTVLYCTVLYCIYCDSFIISKIAISLQNGRLEDKNVIFSLETTVY